MKETKEQLLKKPAVVCLLAVICCFLWGSAIPSIKVGYELFGIPSDATGSQIVFAGYRFALAGLMTIAIGSIGSKTFLFPKKQEWKKVAVLALFQTILQYMFFYIGLSNTTGVKGAIIVATNVFITIMVSSLVFRQEKLTYRKVIGCAVGFAGVVIVNMSEGLDFNLKWNGEGFVLLASVAYAFSSAFIKIYSTDSSPVMLSGYQFTFGGIIMAVIGFLMGGSVENFTSSAILILLYLGFISAVAYSLWAVLLKYNPVSRVSIFGFMNPVFGVILSGLFLGEGQQAFGMKAVIALILVCIGICIVNLHGKAHGREGAAEQK